MSINKLTSIVLGRYVKQNVPAVTEIPDPLRQYLSDEFQSIEVNLQESADANLQVADVQPERPRKGMMRYAVSPWNPLNDGTQGLVVYNGSSWEAVQGSGGGGGPTDAIQDTDFTANGLMKRTGNGTYTSVTDNSSNWDTAYGWGNHGSAGYLTSFTESDPVFTAHAASGVTTTKITNWDTAYGWGDHSSAGYLTSYTESDPLFFAHAASNVTATKISNWDTAYGWGDHGSAGYLTSIADGSITTAKLGNQAVTGAKIAANTISSGNMANNSIFTAAIADGQVTSAKLSDTYLTGIAAGAIDTTELANGAVTNTKIASGAVSNSSLAGSISADKLADTYITEVSDDTSPQLSADLDCNSKQLVGASRIYGSAGSSYVPPFCFTGNITTGMFNPASGAIGFTTNTSERMRIDSTGDVLIGTTSGGSYGSKLRVQGRIETSSGIYALSNGSSFRQGGNYGAATIETRSYSSYSSSHQKQISFRNSTGSEFGSISLVNASTSFNTTSDERLKENIQDAEDAGSKIDAIQIRQFDWKLGGSHQDYGVIAQELRAVAPEAVSEGYTEDDMMSVDYSKLVPTLIKEIQSLRTRIAALENN